MEVMLTAVLGTAASVLSTVSLMPQVIRTWQTRSAGDISATWLVVALIAMVLWICYGSMVGAQAVTWANSLTALQAAFILWVKLRSARPATGHGAEPMIYPQP
jgi:MtN3 and saliva related transmembrane protein